MVQQEIEQANELARQGNSQAAIRLLSKLIQQDASNVEAWLALAEVVDEPERAEFCLQKVLALDPGNAIALKRLSSRSTGGSLSVGSLESAARPDEIDGAAGESKMVLDPDENVSDSDDLQDSTDEFTRHQPTKDDSDEFAPQQPEQVEADSSESQQPLEKEAEPAFTAPVAGAEAPAAQAVEQKSKLGRTDLILIGLTVLAGMVLCALVSAALLT